VIKSLVRTLMPAACLGATVMALAVPASASQAHTGHVAVPATQKPFGKKCTARGDFATCVTSGNVNNPVRISVHVVTSPDQRVSGSWSMVCSKGSGAGSKSGTFGGATPLHHALTMPYARPNSCSVAADAQLSGSGSITVYLTAA
jgi:invasion protein IalB